MMMHGFDGDHGRTMTMMDDEGDDDDDHPPRHDK